MNKKLISNGLNVLYAKIGQCHSKALTTEVSAYLMMAVAKNVPPAVLGRAPQRRQYVQHRSHPLARLLRCRDAHVRSQRGSPAGRTGCDGGEGVKDPACLTMTTESLTREFPLYTPSLLNLVKTSETHVKGLTHEG